MPRSKIIKGLKEADREVFGRFFCIKDRLETEGNEAE